MKDSLTQQNSSVGGGVRSSGWFGSQGPRRRADFRERTGTAALLAAERVGAGGSVLGVDISDNFVARATAAAVGHANVRFARHPMEALALADASFDAATCVLGLMYGAPVSAALGEIARVLVPGGRFAGCVWGRREACGFREMFPILGQQLQMDVCPLFFALGVPGAFAHALERAGLIDAREERVEATWRWRDRDEALRGDLRRRPGRASVFDVHRRETTGGTR